MGVLRRLRGLTAIAASCATLSAGCGERPSAQASHPASSSPVTGRAPAISPTADCPTAPLSVQAQSTDDTPYVWPVLARCNADNVAWKDSPGTLTIAGRCATTLTELAVLDPAHGPAQLTTAGVDAGAIGAVWLLSQDVLLTGGAVLELRGTAVGGDVDVLRMRSNPGPAVADFTDADPTVYTTLRAEWGDIDIESTHVTSWDTTTDQPDMQPNDGRAFIAVRSDLDANGQPLESRMDVRQSEISYLGYHDSEAYGIVWRGPPDNDPTLFTVVNVAGDIEDSQFHDNYFGAYTYGARDMRIRRNEFHHNIGYGLDPHDDSDWLVVEDNSFHDNGTHGFICSKRCDHLQVRRNTSMNNGENGFMLHSDATNWIVEDNQASGNGEGGIALWHSTSNTIRGNVLSNNKFGILIMAGSADNLIQGNEIDGSKSYGLYAYIEDDTIGGDGHLRRNQIVGNIFSNGAGKPINLVDADDNTFAGNRFVEPTGTTAAVSESTGNVFRDNCVAKGLAIESAGGNGIASSTIVDEMSASAQLDATSTLLAQDAAGALFEVEDGHAPDTVSASGSQLSAAGPSTGSVHVSQLPIAVLADQGTARAQLEGWTASGVELTVWPGATGQVLELDVSMLRKGADFSIALDGTPIASGRVDSNGKARALLPIALPPDPGAGLDVLLTLK